jgi:hypothetical protein
MMRKLKPPPDSQGDRPPRLRSRMKRVFAGVALGLLGFMNRGLTLPAGLRFVALLLVLSRPIRVCSTHSTGPK